MPFIKRYISDPTQATLDKNIDTAVWRYSAIHGVDRFLIRAIIKTESDYDVMALREEPHLRDNTGWYKRSLKDVKVLTDYHYCSMGLMQVLFGVASGEYGFIGHPFEMFDPNVNIALGTAHIAKYLKRYKGNLEHAIASYNQGNNGWIDKDGDGIKDPGEPYRNQEYVDKVLAEYERLKKPNPEAEKPNPKEEKQ